MTILLYTITKKVTFVNFLQIMASHNPILNYHRLFISLFIHPVRFFLFYFKCLLIQISRYDIINVREMQLVLILLLIIK